MFKYFFLIAFVAAAFVAASAKTTEVEEHEVIGIVKSEINKNEDGSYDTVYESEDGSSRQESAVVQNAGTEDEALEVKGSYKYINDEGKEVEVFYTAGVNGFVPYGSIINEEISAVAENAKNLPKEEEKEVVKGKKQ